MSSCTGSDSSESFGQAGEIPDKRKRYDNEAITIESSRRTRRRRRPMRPAARLLRRAHRRYDRLAGGRNRAQHYAGAHGGAAERGLDRGNAVGGGGPFLRHLPGAKSGPSRPDRRAARGDVLRSLV